MSQYITIYVDDRVRQRAWLFSDRVRAGVRGYLRSAADEVDAASGRARQLCDAAVDRVDAAVANVSDRIAPGQLGDDDDRREAS